METFSRNLAYACLALLGALPLGCLLGGLLSGLLSLLLPQTSPGTLLGALGFGLVLAIPAFLVGLLPAFLYGAPAYAFLASRGRANYLTATLIGAAPAVLAGNDPAVAAMLSLFGIAVASLTHLFVSLRPGVRGHGSNNSFKPTPPRGAA